MAKILAQAKPTNTIEMIKASLLGMKYMEIKPIPPKTNDRAWAFRLPICLAMYGRRKATKAETKL